MEPEVTQEWQIKITKRVRKLLERNNLYQMTEKKVRELASEDLDINLSDEPFKSVVSRAIEDFLENIKNKNHKTSVQAQEKVKEKKGSK